MGQHHQVQDIIVPLMPPPQLWCLLSVPFCLSPSSTGRGRLASLSTCSLSGLPVHHIALPDDRLHIDCTRAGTCIGGMNTQWCSISCTRPMAAPDDSLLPNVSSVLPSPELPSRGSGAYLPYLGLGSHFGRTHVLCARWQSTVRTFQDPLLDQ